MERSVTGTLLKCGMFCLNVAGCSFLMQACYNICSEGMTAPMVFFSDVSAVICQSDDEFVELCFFFFVVEGLVQQKTEMYLN